MCKSMAFTYTIINKLENVKKNDLIHISNKTIKYMGVDKPNKKCVRSI